MYIPIWIVVGSVWDSTFKYQRVLRAEIRSSENASARSKQSHSRTSIDMVVKDCCSNDECGRPCIKSLVWFTCAAMSWVLLMVDIAGCGHANSTIFMIGLGVPFFSVLGNWFCYKNAPKLRKDALKLENRINHPWSKGQVFLFVQIQHF